MHTRNPRSNNRSTRHSHKGTRSNRPCSSSRNFSPAQGYVPAPRGIQDLTDGSTVTPPGTQLQAAGTMLTPADVAKIQKYQMDFLDKAHQSIAAPQGKGEKVKNFLGMVLAPAIGGLVGGAPGAAAAANNYVGALQRRTREAQAQRNADMNANVQALYAAGNLADRGYFKPIQQAYTNQLNQQKEDDKKAYYASKAKIAGDRFQWDKDKTGALAEQKERFHKDSMNQFEKTWDLKNRGLNISTDYHDKVYELNKWHDTETLKNAAQFRQAALALQAHGQDQQLGIAKAQAAQRQGALDTAMEAHLQGLNQGRKLEILRENAKLPPDKQVDPEDYMMHYQPAREAQQDATPEDHSARDLFNSIYTPHAITPPQGTLGATSNLSQAGLPQEQQPPQGQLGNPYGIPTPQQVNAPQQVPAALSRPLQRQASRVGKLTVPPPPPTPRIVQQPGHPVLSAMTPQAFQAAVQQHNLTPDQAKSYFIDAARKRGYNLNQALQMYAGVSDNGR